LHFLALLSQIKATYFELIKDLLLRSAGNIKHIFEINESLFLAIYLQIMLINLLLKIALLIDLSIDLFDCFLNPHSFGIEVKILAER
jgi:hypothetical protein